jgi:pre-mRNA-splicing factor ATP-dependent RNA helicase DHX38/PRP16
MTDHKKDDYPNQQHRLTSLLPSSVKGGLQPKHGATSTTTAPPIDNNDSRQRRTHPQQQPKGKQYRSNRLDAETPSDPGGVNREARNRATQRSSRNRGGAGGDRPWIQQQQRGDNSSRVYDDRRATHHRDSGRGGGDARRRDDASSRGISGGCAYDDDSSNRRGARGRGIEREEETYKDQRYHGRSDHGEASDDRSRSRDDRRRDKNASAASSSRRYDDSHYQRDLSDDRYRDQAHDDRRIMLPPPNRSNTDTYRRSNNSNNNNQSHVTPSTVSTASRHNNNTTSTYNHRSLDAPTPRRYQEPESAQPNSRSTSAWDVETPAPMNDNDPDTALVEPEDEFDREFYLQEDEGHYVQDDAAAAVAAGTGASMGRFLYTNAKIEAREAALERQRQGRVSARQSALQDDQDAWETNRLLSSGAAVAGARDMNYRTEQDTRVTLLVHQIKPPFLDGRVSFSTVRDAVPTVRDASSDFAKSAREGSETLRQLRANRDKNAMRTKFWELGGTRMGDAVGVKALQTTGEQAEEAKEREETKDDGEIDYKKSSGFASHMRKGNEAVSDFARKKSIRQQREFLPVYTVREELLNVIRENNVVVIVGETGSGRFC